MKGKTFMEFTDDILLVPSHLRKSLGQSDDVMFTDVIYLNIKTFKNIDLLIEVLYHELEHSYVLKAIRSSKPTKQEGKKMIKFKCLEFVHSNPSFTMDNLQKWYIDRKLNVHQLKKDMEKAKE
jgi:hypothetical protein